MGKPRQRHAPHLLDEIFGTRGNDPLVDWSLVRSMDNVLVDAVPVRDLNQAGAIVWAFRECLNQAKPETTLRKYVHIFLNSLPLQNESIRFRLIQWTEQCTAGCLDLSCQEAASIVSRTFHALADLIEDGPKRPRPENDIRPRGPPTSATEGNRTPSTSTRRNCWNACASARNRPGPGTRPSR